MKVYILYLDSKNKYRPAKKYFKTFEAAQKWMCKTFEKPSIDFIHYV